MSKTRLTFETIEEGYRLACEEIRGRGCRVSAGSHCRKDYAVVFSVESGSPATYGHPRHTITIDRKELPDGTVEYYGYF